MPSNWRNRPRLWNAFEQFESTNLAGSGFAMTAGPGLELRITDRVGLGLIQAEYLRRSVASATTDDLRIQTGVSSVREVLQKYFRKFFSVILSRRRACGNVGKPSVLGEAFPSHCGNPRFVRISTGGVISIRPLPFFFLLSLLLRSRLVKTFRARIVFRPRSPCRLTRSTPGFSSIRLR